MWQVCGLHPADGKHIQNQALVVQFLMDIGARNALLEDFFVVVVREENIRKKIKTNKQKIPKDSPMFLFFLSFISKVS